MSFYTCEYCNKKFGYNEQKPWKIVSPYEGSEDLFCNFVCVIKFCENFKNETR